MSISDGVKVLIITVCGYTFTYAYYLGYYAAKEIPVEFIDVSLLSMMKIGFGTCAILSFVLYCLDLFKVEIEDPVGVSINTKRFLIRHSIGIITMLLFTVNMAMSGKWLSLILPFMIWYVCLKQDITISFKDLETKRFKIKVSINPLKNLGSTIVAEKLNVRTYYVWFSWYLALLFLLFNVGGVFSHMIKDTLVCNKDIHVVSVGDSDVLVTRDHKNFEFMDKKDCKFSIPEIK
ncbi:hypothetical protein PJX90_10065 [Klebsiella aerogenes]|uniref:hypothetical protein n=1 Tax=Klebsiella aerogenes TaxID=548 RepID=UPI002FF5040A|nr:hypothetical protein [Klebsiella aerogenes]